MGRSSPRATRTWNTWSRSTSKATLLYTMLLSERRVDCAVVALFVSAAFWHFEWKLIFANTNYKKVWNGCYGKERKDENCIFVSLPECCSVLADTEPLRAGLFSSPLNLYWSLVDLLRALPLVMEKRPTMQRTRTFPWKHRWAYEVQQAFHVCKTENVEERYCLSSIAVTTGKSCVGGVAVWSGLVDSIIKYRLVSQAAISFSVTVTKKICSTSSRSRALAYRPCPKLEMFCTSVPQLFYGCSKVLVTICFVQKWGRHHSFTLVYKRLQKS